MSMDRIIRMFAGMFVLVSLALGWVVSPYWYLVTAFVGLNLSQSSLTGFCPLEMMLDKMKVGQLTSNAGV